MFKRLLSLALPLFALSFLSSTAARADDVFTLTYIPGNVTETFTLPGTPAVTGFTTYSFTVDNVSVSSGGSSFLQDITFYDSPDGGAFAMSGGIALYGPQLYAGSLSAPSIVTGPYVLTDDYLPDYSLSITSLSVVTPTPEPSSLVLLGTGVVGVCSSLLRRRRKA